MKADDRGHRTRPLCVPMWRHRRKFSGASVRNRCGASVAWYLHEGSMTMTLEEARKIIAAAEKKAVEIKTADERRRGRRRRQSCFPRPHGRCLDRQHRHLGQFFGIHASITVECRIMIFAGGIPLKRGGKVVGAVRVSGGSGEQDHTVAQAGADAF